MAERKIQDMAKLPFKDKAPEQGEGKPDGSRYTPTKKGAQVPFNGYVRCDLVKTEREDFDRWGVGLKAGWEWDLILKLTDSGYKFSVGWKGIDMVAMLTCIDSKKPWYGYLLTAFGLDAEQATRAVLYKHYEKLAEEWPTEASDDGWGVR